LDELHVAHERCRRYDGENGYALVRLVDGDRVFARSNKGGIVKDHPITIDEEDIAYIRTFDLVHTSNNSYFDARLPEISHLGVPISYDFSDKWGDRAASVSPYITYGFISCGTLPEKDALEACRKIHEKGCRVVIATMGSKGVLLYDGDLSLYQPPHFVKAVDTLGAGDSFATGFLLHTVEAVKKMPGRMAEDGGFREKIYKTALEKGVSFAAKSCLVKGAFGYGVEVPASVAERIGAY
jgi:sugar/nucleoside kinase (ribokinase family)